MLSLSASYAIRAMAFIAKKGKKRPVLSSAIAENMRIPRNFLSKIINQLVNEGLLVSVRGRGGGLILAKEPKKITLLEIASHFMNIKDLDRCVLGLDHCEGSFCRLHKKCQAITTRLKSLLEKTTIDQVI